MSKLENIKTPILSRFIFDFLIKLIYLSDYSNVPLTQAIKDLLSSSFEGIIIS